LVANAAGFSNAQNVVVTDALPAGLTYVSATPAAGDGSASFSGGVVTWDLSTVAPGTSESLTVTAHVTAPNNTVSTAAYNYSNNASLANLTGYDASYTTHTPSFENSSGQLVLTSTGTISTVNSPQDGTTTNGANGDGILTTAQNYANIADLSASAYNQINYDPVTYTTEAIAVNLNANAVTATITVAHLILGENGGDGEYGAVTAFDANHNALGTIFFGQSQSNIPAVITTIPYALGNSAVFVPVTYAGNGDATFTINSSMFGNHPFEYLAFTAIPYGAGYQLTTPLIQTDSSDYFLKQIVFTTEDGAFNAINNTANIASTSTTNINNVTSASVIVTPVVADLAVNATTANAYVEPGSNNTFTVTLFNNGPSTATNIDVHDAFPAGISLVSSSATLGSYASGDWTIASLASGQTATLTLVGDVTATATVTNTATIQSVDQVDPISANNSSSTYVIPALEHLDATIHYNNNSSSHIVIGEISMINEARPWDSVFTPVVFANGNNTVNVSVPTTFQVLPSDTYAVGLEYNQTVGGTTANVAISQFNAEFTNVTNSASIIHPSSGGTGFAVTGEINPGLAASSTGTLVAGSYQTSIDGSNPSDNSGNNVYLYGNATSGSSHTVTDTGNGNDILNGASTSTIHYTLNGGTGNNVLVYNSQDTAINGGEPSSGNPAWDLLRVDDPADQLLFNTVGTTTKLTNTGTGGSIAGGTTISG